MPLAVFKNSKLIPVTLGLQCSCPEYPDVSESGKICHIEAVLTMLHAVSLLCLSTGYAWKPRVCWLLASQHSKQGSCHVGSFYWIPCWNRLLPLHAHKSLCVLLQLSSLLLYLRLLTSAPQPPNTLNYELFKDREFISLIHHCCLFALHNDWQILGVQCMFLNKWVRLFPRNYLVQFGKWKHGGRRWRVERLFQVLLGLI